MAVVKATLKNLLGKFSTVVLKTLWKLALNSAHRLINKVLDAVCTMMKHFFKQLGRNAELNNLCGSNCALAEKQLGF